MVRDFRPMSFKDCPAEFVDFTLKGDFESGAFKTDVKSAYPAEQGSGFETRGSFGAFASTALRPVGNMLSICCHRRLAD